MFCPKCGSNQGDGKKFCTVCGTNLFIVSQALTGQLAQPSVHYVAPVVSSQEIDPQRDMRQGITMSVLGGGYLIYKIISFIISFPFYGWHSPFGFLSFIAFIFFAVGISKIVSGRVANGPSTNAPLTAVNPLPPSPTGPGSSGTTPPRPVFSGSSTSETSAPRTSELALGRRPTTSVTEDDTKHLGQ